MSLNLRVALLFALPSILDSSAQNTNGLPLLRQLAEHTLTSGFGAKDWRALQQYESQAIKEADHSAEVLESELASINARLNDPAGFDDPTGRKGRIASQEQMLIMFVLADLYRHVSPGEQASVLKAIQNSVPHLPTTNGEVIPQLWSFLAIGKDSVPYMVPLMSYPNRVIRCQAQAALAGLTKNSNAPKLNCDKGVAFQTRQIKKWKSWWKANSSSVKFDPIPTPIQERH